MVSSLQSIFRFLEKRILRKKWNFELFSQNLLINRGWTTGKDTRDTSPNREGSGIIPSNSGCEGIFECVCGGGANQSAGPPEANEGTLVNDGPGARDRAPRTLMKGPEAFSALFTISGLKHVSYHPKPKFQAWPFLTSWPRMTLTQARIQDFAYGGVTAKRGPEIRGSWGQGSHGTPYQKPKSLRIWGTIF